jgi:cystathionine gamma-synthase
MKNYFSKIPCGCSLPFRNPHAISVSLPTIQDVIDYEEGKPNVTNIMESGYPRFFMNKLVKKLLEYVKNKHGIPNNKLLLPIDSIHAKNILEKLVNKKLDYIEEYESVFLLFDNNDTLATICKNYIQNIGLLISSRKAEATLFSLQQIPAVFQEEKMEVKQAEKTIKTILTAAYNIDSQDNILLTNSGMNAVFSAYETIATIRKVEARETIVQLGWLYVDTMEIIEYRNTTSYIQVKLNDKTKLEKWLLKNHTTVASIVTEITTNPLIQTVDLPWLYDLCKKYSIILIVDTTIATPFNINVLSFCDIAVESLTKFASGGGDILMGAIILNNNCELIQKNKHQFSNFIIPPYKGEISRLGHQICNYESRVKKVAQNTQLIYNYLIKQPFIKEVYSVYHPDFYDNYLKIKKHDHALPGLISIIFDQDLSHYYDKLLLAKGPSLGTEFTIAMPYVYLAHYECLKTENGRTKLKNLGLNPELLRLSIGIEPIEEIIAAFETLKNTYNTNFTKT